MERRLIKVKEVMHLTSLSRAHIYRLEYDPKYERYGFPKRVRLGCNRVGWWVHEIIDWLHTRPRA